MSIEWLDLSDRELESIYLHAAAQNLQWMLESCELGHDRLRITGWAIALAGQPEEAKFLINGRRFESIAYPLPSPDIEAVFWNTPTATRARFQCETRIDDETF